MVTFEDVARHFLESAERIGLVAHPEYWLNSRSLDREFSCTYHSGVCEEEEKRSSCVLELAWGPLDTVLSQEGAFGICDFFHEPDGSCPHLQTSDIPPLSLDLTYTLPLEGLGVSDEVLLSLMRLLRLQASEHSQRTIETRPTIRMALQDNRLVPDTLTLLQRVELPIWHPEGIRGLLAGQTGQTQERVIRNAKREDGSVEEVELFVDTPQPEEWIPQIALEVVQDIQRVLSALEASRISQQRNNVPDNS